jgi:hypothetical protein
MPSRRRFEFLFRSIAVAAAILPGGSGLGAEVIDRVMAVVGGQLITQSDVRGALAFGLVDVGEAADPVGRALDRLIDRELVLSEVDRYQPPEPRADEVAARVQAIERRFPSQAAFTAALNTSGFTEARLSEAMRNDLRIERYLEQRFTATAQPTDEEVATYFRDHASEFASGGRTPPLDEVREQVRRKLTAERHAALVADWIQGLQRRADIIRLYLPQGQGTSDKR